MRLILAVFFAFTLLFSADNAEFADEFDVEFKEAKPVFDPLSGYNRVMTNINDVIYEYALTPIAKGYAYIVPKPARTAISNFFDNLMFPMRFINNVLQLKFKQAGEETLRFLANTIIGFGGLTDGAKYYGLKAHDEDFGQTLGYWGVGSGFHVVLPLLGPSNLRDIVGRVGDYFSDPISYMDNKELALGIKTFRNLNEFSHNPDIYNNIKKDALDLYPFLRDTYEQRRDHLIKE